MSVSHVRLSEAAAVDINEQADWFEEKSDWKLAERWSKAVTSAVLRILKNPRSGAPCRFRPTELQGIRRVPISGFQNTWSFTALRTMRF